MSKKKLQSHELKEAVRAIPSLIVEEIRKNAISSHHNTTSITSTKASVKSLPKPTVYLSPQRSRRWMFIGVGACLLTILGFWFVYITDTIQQNKLTLNPAKAFADSGQNDLSMLIATFTKMENELKGNIKSPAELKLMVAQALMPLLTASSTATTTTATTTTTVTTTP
ncbi:MAG TPA: hypothetical protein PK295_00190 [Candidatus Magasanikbacteria bacterium]|nr:hypothetical protein [Candidatus Magasanikbacteria bacterium]